MLSLYHHHGDQGNRNHQSSEINGQSPTTDLVEPQDLSVRPKKRRDDAETNVSACRCHICNILLLDQHYLSRHLDEAHSDLAHASDGQSTTPKSFMEQFSNGGTNMNGRNNFHTLFDSGSMANAQMLLNAASMGCMDQFLGAMTAASVSDQIDQNGRPNAVINCDVCNKEFSSNLFLETHKANVHGITTDSHQGAMTRSIHEPPNGNHRSGQQTPKTPQSQSGFEQASNMGNPMNAFQFPMSMDQQQLAANVCPFCYQFFPNAMLLQSHVLTNHPALLMNPTAAVYMASLMSSSPFNNAGTMFQPPSINGKNNAQQQQQLAAIAAAMLGFGTMPANDPTSATVGSNLDALMQQQMPKQDLNFASTASSISNASLFSGQQQNAMAAAYANQRTPGKNYEAYCDICRKEFCNKYFLRTHKLNKHGILEESPRSNGGNCSKRASTNSPGIRPTYSNGRDGSVDLNQESAIAEILKNIHNSSEDDDDDGAPVAKMAKVSDDASEACSSGTHVSINSGQFSCNLCVKTFPSMFALVAHKYRDHGTFDGISAASLGAGDNSNSGQQDTKSPASLPGVNFGQSSSQPRLQARKSLDNEFAFLSSPAKTQNVDLEAFCEMCQKEFCSKYFLKVHKANIHGMGTENSNGSPIVNGNGQYSATGQTLNGILNDASSMGLNLSMNQEKENGRRHSTNGTPTTAALLLMAAAGMPTGPQSIAVGRQLVASKNFCDICNKELCNKYFLRTHMLKMHGIVIDENKTIIANINTLDKEKNGELLFRCDLCGEQLASRHQLRAHKQSVHQIVVPSSSCFNTTPLPSSANQSPNLNVTSNSTKSENGTVQDLTFNATKHESGTDQTKNTGTVEITNQDCTSKLSSTPISISSDFRAVLCTICGKRYKNARCLRIHILNDHVGMVQKGDANKPSLVCEYCSNEFSDHPQLQLHVINEHHNEVRGSVASMAEQAALDALSNSSAFVAAVNSVVNAVAEAAASNETSSTSSVEAKLENSATEAKPSRIEKESDLPLVTKATNGTKLFRCSYCNYYTKWISNLSTHEKRHNVGKPANSESGEKPFKCRMCLRSYRYSHSLQRHMEVHKSAALGMRDRYLSNGHRLPIANSPATPSPVVEPSPNDHGSKTPPALNSDQNNDSTPINLSALDQPQLTVTRNPNTVVNGSPTKFHHCQMCGKSFGNRELYRLHVLTLHNMDIGSADVGANGSPTKRVHRCRMCRFATTKSYDDLRMHMVQKHSTSSSYSPKKRTTMIINREEEIDRDESNENAGFGCTVQPFMVKETSGIGVFPTSTVVYLPVLRKVQTVIDVKFTLTPLQDDQPLENGKHE